MSDLLNKIHRPSDVKALNYDECNKLAAEIRCFLVNKVGEHGGHLSSNLGAVELTLALHRTFSAPSDKIIWDVGHQAYTHKILTGRADGFDSLREENGLSGFPRTAESEYDLFNAGHASDSISLAYGMAVARDRLKEDYSVVCVIGDGALSGGLAFEALNDAGKSRHKMIIVLNDNGMAIAHSVGSLSNHLYRLRSGKGYLKSKKNLKTFLNSQKILHPLYQSMDRAKDRLKYAAIGGGIIFEEMGLTYLGPVNGHDIEAMEDVFARAKQIEKSVIIHVKTKKGKGYWPAEENPELYHGIGKFSVEEGAKESTEDSYSALFGQNLIRLAEKDSKVQCITAAMAYGCGLSEFRERFPNQIRDVGIAEAHGASFAAGLAKSGLKPYYAVYSTFSQRAYDEILEDIALNNLPVTLALDRSGISGNDGETHQGIFDLAFLGHIPNLAVLSPASAEDFERMMDFTYQNSKPFVLRYPKGKPWHEPETLPNIAIEFGKGRVIKQRISLKKGKGSLCIMALGACVPLAYEAALAIEAEGGSATVFDLRFASPLDKDAVLELARSHDYVITMEDAVRKGGVGESIGSLMMENQIASRLSILAYSDAFIPQGNRQSLMEERGLSANHIVELWRAQYGK